MRLSQSNPTAASRRPWWFGIVVLALVAAAATGCVRRRMTIRSEPSGALVSVDDHEIGVTPVSTNFTYYGTRKVRLVKDGYETLTVMQPVPTPWYEVPPLDFISENLVPGEIQDRQSFSYQLRPQVVTPTDQLRSRAEELRARAHPPVGVLGPVQPGAPPIHALPPSGPAGVPPGMPSGVPEPIPTPPAQPSPGSGAWAAPPMTPSPVSPPNTMVPPAWEQ